LEPLSESLSEDELSEDELPEDELSGDELSEDELSEDQLTASLAAFAAFALLAFALLAMYWRDTWSTVTGVAIAINGIDTSCSPTPAGGHALAQWPEDPTRQAEVALAARLVDLGGACPGVEKPVQVQAPLVFVEEATRWP
jgi:hypothetical protein